MTYRHRIQNPSIVKFNGTREAAIAFGNGLNHLVELGILKDFTFDKAIGRKDGEVDQIFRLQVIGATNYDTRAEPAYEDKSGHVYLMMSLETNGRYKLGESVRPRQREQEVCDSYQERFKIIAVQYVAENRFARETYLKKWAIRKVVWN